MMNASEVSTPDVTPAPSGAADVASEGTLNPPTVNGSLGLDINKEQLLVEGPEPEAKKASLNEDHITINQVLVKIRNKAAKIAEIAQQKGTITTKNLHSHLLQVRENTASTVLSVCSALEHNIDTASFLQETVQSYTDTLETYCVTLNTNTNTLNEAFNKIHNLSFLGSE